MQIDIASRLIIAVKNIAEYTSLGAGFHEAVTARVVGNQCTVFRGAQIVGPWLGGIRSRYNIFPVLVIKVSVLHVANLSYKIFILYRAILVT